MEITQNIKKGLTLLVALLTAFSAAADYFWAVNADGVPIYYCTSSTEQLTVLGVQEEYSGNVNIPAFVVYNGNEYSVTSIGANAFCDRSGLTSVTIPESVTEIGYDAFSYCSGLTSVSIGEGVNYIGSWAFRGCSGLTSITIPENVTEIEEGAFSGCKSLIMVNYNAINCTTKAESEYDTYYPPFSGCYNLTTLNIGENVQTIPAYAFSYCGLTSVTIPAGVTSI